MKRLFNKRQKNVLRLLSGNLCKICGEKLTSDFQGDHVVSYSNGGATIIKNGQALCPKCNLTKGNKHE
jgi:YgiT-type zinc finger domain-containing protein